MTRIARIALLLLLPLAAPLRAQRAAPAAWTDTALAATLDSLARGFGGEVGIYVRHLPTGASAALRADELFPTASLIKVPILLTLYDQVEQGKLDLDARVPYPDTLHYRYVESTDVVGYMVAGDTLPLSELAFLMLSVSDNLASLWIQGMIGGGATVNEWMAAHGFEQTRVNSRTPGREDGARRVRLGADDAARDRGGAGDDPRGARREPARVGRHVPHAHPTATGTTSAFRRCRPRCRRRPSRGSWTAHARRCCW